MPCSLRRALFLAPALSALLALFVAPAAAVQSGAFAPGELLVRGPSTASTLDTLYRIDPLTGHGEAWFDEVFPNYSEVAWAAYDPWRNRVLVYASQADFGLFSPQLFSVATDGSAQGLGFDSAEVTSLAPIGDGRVYMNVGGELQVLLPDDSSEVVLDENGQGIDLGLDHLAWDAAGQRLIGVATQAFSSPCHSIWQLQLHAFPLAGDPAQLSGPGTCTNYDYGPGNTHYPVGLDRLPGGGFLIAMSNVDFASDEVLYELDPTTLGISLWSPATLSNLDGGVWSSAAGRAFVLVDDNQSDALRTFTAQQGGSGTPFAVDVPVGTGSTGQGTGNRLYGVDLLGQAACLGFSVTLGDGLAGSGGAVPGLHVVRCPRVGATFELQLDGLLGQAEGLLAVGQPTAPLAFFGGELHAAAPYVVLANFTADGASGAPGAGRARLELPVPALPQLAGQTFAAQAATFDGAAAQGLALTPGQAITLGG